MKKYAVLCALLLTACGGVLDNSPKADPQGIFSGTINNANTGTTDNLVVAIDASGKGFAIDLTETAIYRLTSMSIQGNSFTAQYRGFGEGGVAFPNGQYVDTGILNGTIQARSSLTGTASIGGSSLTSSFNANYSAAGYEIAATFSTVAGAYGYTIDTSSGNDTVTLNVSDTGQITGTDSFGCTLTGNATIPNPLGNIYEISVASICSSGTTKFTGFAIYSPASGGNNASLFIEYDDGASEAVIATANQLTAPLANFELGQPNWQNTTANRGLNNVATANSLNSPGSAAISVIGSATTFYIADTGNNRIVGFTSLPNGNSMANFEIGQGDITGTDLTSNTPGFSDGSSMPLQLSSPSRVRTSPDGTKLLVVDSSNNRVLIWNALPTKNAKPNIILGDSTGGSGVPVTASGLNAPFGATFAPSASFPNRVIVADTGNNRVLVFNNPTTGSSADFVLGQRSLTPVTSAPTSTGNSANCPQLTSSITINCDSSNFRVGADTVANPSDVWSDGVKLLVADAGNNRVLYYPTMPNATGSPATYVLGQTTMTTRSPSGGGASGFTNPSSVWADSGKIYVADTGNNRVLVFDYPTSNGNTAAAAVYGQGNFTNIAANDEDQNGITDKDKNGMPQANDRTLYAPGGMVTVTSGTTNLIYVLDSGNNRMMTFNVN